MFLRLESDVIKYKVTQVLLEYWLSGEDVFVCFVQYCILRA